MCSCGRTVLTGTKPKIARTCKACNTTCSKYQEAHLFLDEYKLTAHPDLVMLYNGVYHIYEIKTLDRKSIDFDTMEAPLGDHVLQGNMYYWIMKLSGYNVSSVVRYLYIDRGNSKLFRGNPYREFAAPVWPRSRVQVFFDKAKKTKEALDSKSIPDRVCKNHSSVRAKNCPRVVECFSTRKG